MPLMPDALVASVQELGEKGIKWRAYSFYVVEYNTLNRTKNHNGFWLFASILHEAWSSRKTKV